MDTSQNVSFQFFHGEGQQFESQPSLTLFFGLHGTAEILCGGKVYPLAPAGLLAVNPFELFRAVCPGDAAAIALYIPRGMLRLAGWDDSVSCRFCAASGEASTEGFQEIRRLYASIFQAFFQDCEQNASRVASRAIRLAGVLLSRFSVRAEQAAAGQREQSMLRLKRILDTIHDHWNEELSLSEIAKNEYLSVSYLSRFFKSSLHMTFKER